MRWHVHFEVACHNEATDARMSISVASADYNQDGWVDFIVGNMDEGYRLYENQQGTTQPRHWLSIELEGADPSTGMRSAHGRTSPRKAERRCRRSSTGQA
jgi:hypothetical protein